VCIVETGACERVLGGHDGVSEISSSLLSICLSHLS
jgi:hypothetical protein